MDRHHVLADSDQQGVPSMTSYDPQRNAFNDLDDLRLPYSLMDPTALVGAGNAPFFLDIYPQQSHDDSCLDNCQTIAVFNGSRFPHRAGPASTMSRSYHPAAQPFAFDASQTTSMFALQPFPQRQQLPKSGPDMLVPLPDKDSAASSCCDSDCSMPDKCTDVSCENTTNACNDQNCPERVEPRLADFDVATGAAALISINHAQDLQDVPVSSPLHSYTASAFDHPRRHSMAALGPGADDGLMMGHDPEQHDAFQHSMGTFTDLLNMRDITTHIIKEHGDQQFSGCSGPSCLVDSMPDYSVCHLPSLDNQRFVPHFAAAPFFPGAYPECGTSISTPEDWVHHFNECHRRQLQDFSDFIAMDASNGQHLTATGLMSPHAVDDTLSPSHLEHFSMAAMSSNPTKEELGISPMVAPGTRSSSETSPGPLATLPRTPTSATSETPKTDITIPSEAEQHKCQWREGHGAVCGQVFATNNDLFDHVNTLHVKAMAKGDDGYLCQWEGCSRMTEGKGGFPQRSKIERHMQTHVGYKPHICAQCGAGFSAKQALDQHLLIHTDQKPLECPTCGKKIRHQSALTMHMRTHTGEKPLQCNICGKRFSESSNLSKHKRTHEERGRFSCTYPGCEANFHRQDQLRRHRNNCHKDDPSRAGSPCSTVSESAPEPSSVGPGSGRRPSRPMCTTGVVDLQPIRKVRTGAIAKRERAS